MLLLPKWPLQWLSLCAVIWGQALPGPLLYYSLIHLPPRGGGEPHPSPAWALQLSSGAGGEEGVKGASTEVPGSLETL